jgi:hypothetical protein
VGGGGQGQAAAGHTRAHKTTRICVGALLRPGVCGREITLDWVRQTAVGVCVSCVCVCEVGVRCQRVCMWMKIWNELSPVCECVRV